jgi:hypothetical protein
VQTPIRCRRGEQGYIGRYCSPDQSKLTIEEMAQEVSLSYFYVRQLFHRIDDDLKLVLLSPTYELVSQVIIDALNDAYEEAEMAESVVDNEETESDLEHPPPLEEEPSLRSPKRAKMEVIDLTGE